MWIVFLIFLFIGVPLSNCGKVVTSTGSKPSIYEHSDGFTIFYQNQVNGILEFFRRKYDSSFEPISQGYQFSDTSTICSKSDNGDPYMCPIDGKDSFILSWEGKCDSNDYNFVRYFDLNGYTGYYVDSESPSSYNHKFIDNEWASTRVKVVSTNYQGQFVVVWKEDRYLYGQRFDYQRNAIQNDFQILSGKTKDTLDPSLFPLEQRFVAIYNVDSPYSSSTYDLIMYDYEGTEITAASQEISFSQAIDISEIQISSHSNIQNTFLLTYRDQDGKIYARLYDFLPSTGVLSLRNEYPIFETVNAYSSTFSGVFADTNTFVVVYKSSPNKVSIKIISDLRSDEDVIVETLGANYVSNPVALSIYSQSNTVVVAWQENSGEIKLSNYSFPCYCDESVEDSYSINSYSQCFCQCKAGYYLDSICKPCAIGSYKISSGNGACSVCSGDLISTVTEGSTKVEECVCDIGAFYDDNRFECIECLYDAYKDTKGNQACTSCPDNKTTNNTRGATNIASCLEIADPATDPNNPTDPTDPTDPNSNNECNGVIVSDFCVQYSLIITIVAGCIGIPLVLVCLVIAIIICIACILVDKFRKKANRFDHIKDIDILVQEAELEQKEENTSKFGGLSISKIKKRIEIIDISEIELKKVIGQGGSSSKIFLAEWNGEKCVFKSFKNMLFQESGEDDYLEFEKEIEIVVSLNHPSILRFFGAVINPPKVGIVMQYCEHGDLIQFFVNFKRKHLKPYPIREKLRIIKEISAGMKYLHSRKIIHRDLKPQNILIDSSEKSKIMDFGLSRLKSAGNQTMTSKIGTAFYIAPEVFKLDGKYSYPCDVYSWSMLVFYVVTENCPFGAQDSSTVNLKIMQDQNFRPNIRENDFKGYEFLVQVIKKCWDHDPNVRHTFDEIHSLLLEYEEKRNEVNKNKPKIPKKMRRPSNRGVKKPRKPSTNPTKKLSKGIKPKRPESRNTKKIKVDGGETQVKKPKKKNGTK